MTETPAMVPGDIITVGDGHEKKIVVRVDAEGFDADDIVLRGGNTGRGIYGVWHPAQNVFALKAIDVPATGEQIARLRALPPHGPLLVRPDVWWAQAMFIAPQLLADSLNVLYAVAEAPKMAKVVLS